MTENGDFGFDVLGELPVGVTLIEASAGTGKTHTIASLATRVVAEGVPVDHLLIVTFGRVATGELRSRVRERLAAAERGLRSILTGAGAPSDDELVHLLAQDGLGEVEERRQRLAVALASFDAATIATTHGFCHHVLSGLGVAGDVESDVNFLESASDLIDEVVDDLYLRKFHRTGRAPFGRSEALAIAHAVVSNPSDPIVPLASTNENRILRARFAAATRHELNARKRRLKVMTYDDLLTRLVGTLRDTSRGPAACARLRERYRVVLVDEFQDTDPVQWEILERAFVRGGTALVLIGDPKQAIYAFRGADVFSYLRATQVAGHRGTLSVNWRSDQRLIDAYDRLFSDAKLGHDQIAYRSVRAAPPNLTPRIEGTPVDVPLRVRVVHREDGNVTTTRQLGVVEASSGRKHVAEDLAADVVRLLSSGASIVGAPAAGRMGGSRGSRHRGARLGPDADSPGREAGREPLRPGHIAVLVRTNRQTGVVRTALDEVGVPAVINGAGSVFASEAARDWLTLLEGLERPSAPPRAHAVALSNFLGWTADEVARAAEREWEGVHVRLHRWARVLRERGVASLLEIVAHSEALPGRLLVRSGGERLLTDLRHVGELLHVESMTHGLGAAALTGWLRDQVAARTSAGAWREQVPEEESRRLDSDAEAVQVLTIHRSKGLEYPIVYLPYLWDAGYFDDAAPVVFHDPDNDHCRTIDVAMSGGAFAKHQKLAREEQRAEDLRLAYVALTRAEHQAVLWWATGSDSEISPLARLLFSRDENGVVQPYATMTPDESDVIDRLEELGGGEHLISIERCDGRDGSRWSPRDLGGPVLDSSAFSRDLDARWRRTSYSGITFAAHEPQVGSEPDAIPLTDEEMVGPSSELVEALDPVVIGERLKAMAVPLASTPGGAEVGSMIHSVFEHVDFASEHLQSDLRAAVEAESWRNLGLGDVTELVGGLIAAIETPLGPLHGDMALRDVPKSDRLDELGFELPLVGGDDPTAELTLEALAELLERRVAADDPLAGYSRRLRDPSLTQTMTGYLAGSIDTVFRTRTSGGPPRFTVVDYKTNWLGTDPVGGALTSWDYRPAALADAMQRAHYPLQALIYSVALHRYLRWRLRGYEPEVHLGGVLYLFLRGMTGTDVPRVGDQPCGVFSWHPLPSLIVELSELFDQGEQR